MQYDANDTKTGPNWLGVCFGLVFAIAGLFAVYMSAGKMLYGYAASADWRQVPADIHKLELVPHYGDTTTYSVEGRYTYQYNGKTYQSDRVSLSTVADNIGNYWHELYDSLQNDRTDNELSAYVNPDNPQEAVLDRTLRWKAVVFASMFFFAFTGFGALITWLSFRRTQTRAEQRSQQLLDGISSEQKVGGLFLTAFGCLVLIIGTGISILAIPEELQKGNYAVLLVLVSVVAGAALAIHGFKQHFAFKRIGPTPLFLDPAAPGVGGQLGGTFELHAVSSSRQVLSPESLLAAQVTLSCIRIRRSGKSRTEKVIWHEQSPLYLQQTDKGYKATFLFDIPDDCSASTATANRSEIVWKVSLQEELSGSMGKLERTWVVNIDDYAYYKTSNLAIPELFLKRANKASRAAAKVSGLAQIPLTDTDHTIHIHSRTGRDTGSKLMGLAFGAVFVGAGIFTVMQHWWPGYIFILIGGIIEICTIYSLGKGIEVEIDKRNLELTTRESWMGMVYTHKEAQVFTAEQFTKKKKSSMQQGSKITEYYVINFNADSGEIRIADGIKSKQAADALIFQLNELLGKCFVNNQQLRKAA